MKVFGIGLAPLALASEAPASYEQALPFSLV